MVDQESAEVRLCAVHGCDKTGTKMCSRCGKEAYCSAECQRRAWKAHKLVCQKADSLESDASEFLRAGRLYAAKEVLCRLPARSAALEADLNERIQVGIHHEIVEDRLRLADVDGCGVGYVATRALREGEPLLFDTAFVSASLNDKKEFHFLIAERASQKGHSTARRSSSKADARADFYFDRVQALFPKGGLEMRSWLADTVDEETGEQMLLCSIAEGCCLPSAEDPPSMGLFVAAARFNHSCSPNACFESTRSSILVRAAADVSEGEEVTISYLPAEQLCDGATRRAALRELRGFDCLCRRCLSEGLVGSAASEGAPRDENVVAEVSLPVAQMIADVLPTK